MPELADLGAALATFLLWALMAVMVWMLTQANNHISFLGWHPLSFLVNTATDLRNDLWHTTMWELKAAWTALSWLINVQRAFIGAVLAAFAHLLDLHRFVVGTAIPHAAAQVQQQAMSATALEHTERVQMQEALAGDINRTADRVHALEVYQVHALPAVITAQSDKVINPAIDHLTQVTEQEIAAAKADALAAVATVATTVTSLAEEYARCAVTMCAGPNQIASVLNDLLQATSFAAEFGFLGAAIKDPVGTANALDATIGGLFDAGHNLFDALLSI